MKILEVIGGIEPDLIKVLEDFLPLAMKELGITKLPRIKLEKTINNPDQPTFGKFVNKEQTVYLGIANRHPLDIARTLAHELVHFRQYITGKLPKNGGETGSPQENEAHVVAGVIMRHFNKKYPQHFGDHALEIDL